MADAGELDYPYEASDEASETELLDRSLSVWKGWSSIENEDFAPIPLDLHTASSIGQYDCVRNIIQRGEENLDRKNKGGWTALMYACYIGHDTIVNLLLEAGVCVNVKNNKGQSPLMLAASCGNESVAYFLLNHKQGADLEACDLKGWTALFHATYSGHQDMVKFLLESGTNCEVKEPSREFTPFMEAAAAGHEIIVQYFLLHGVDVNAKSCSGDTARCLALMNGHTKIVSMIDNYGQSHLSPRTDTCLNFEGDLSSSDEAFQNPRRHSPRNSRCKKQGPSIREGPEAMSKLINQGKHNSRGSQSRGASEQNISLVPKGYVTFPNSLPGPVEPPGSEIRFRDVTSPINHEDHRPLDSSGGRESSHEVEEDGSAFSKTGALTIKSSSSSSGGPGGLVAALGLSRENSMESIEDTSSEPLHQPVTTAASSNGSSRSAQGQGARVKGHGNRAKPRRQPNRETRAETIPSQNNTVKFSSEQQILGPQYNIPNYTSTYTQSPSSSGGGKPLAPPPGIHTPPNPINCRVKEVEKVTRSPAHSNTPGHNIQSAPTRTQSSAHPSNRSTTAAAHADAGTASNSSPTNKELSAEARAEQARVLANRPRDLATLLAQLGLSKYLPTFEEQDVDLQVFLSLTDNDLKEVGIKLFGPRRKMTNSIARWHSNAMPPSHDLEKAYADKLEAEMQEMAIQLHQSCEQNESLKQQVLQEQELRSVTEGCLMEDRAAWQKVSRIAADTRLRCDDLRLLIHKIRLYQDELARRFGADKQGQLTGSGSHDSLVAALQEGLSLEEKRREIPLEITKLPTQQLIRQLRKWSDELEGVVTLVTASTDKLLGREVKFEATMHLPGYT